MDLAKLRKKFLIATAIAITVGFLLVALHWTGLLAIAELKSLDHRFQQYADPSLPGHDIVLVAIDEQSLAAFGRWPWSRDRHGFMTHYLRQAGVVRRLPLFARVEDSRFALTHLVASVARQLLNAERAIIGPRSIAFGSATIPVAPDGDLVIDWHGDPKKTYRAYSAGAILKAYLEMQQGQPPSLDPALFKDKIVFIAGTAAGIYDLRATPVDAASPGVLIHMTALDNILRGRFMQPAPYWSFLVTMVVLCLATACSFMLLNNQVLKFTVVAGLALAYYGLAVHAFKSHGLWLELAFPEAAVAMTFAVAASVEYL